MFNVRSFVIGMQYVAIVILFVELIFACLQKPSEMQKHIIVVTFSTIIMFAGYLVELESENVAETLAGVTLAYIGKPFVMLSTFMFICSFYNKKVPAWAFVSLSVLCSLFPIIVYTNKFHYLYYASVEFNPESMFTPLILTRGPLYYSYMILTVAFFLSCIVIIVKEIRNTTSIQSRRFATYLVMMVSFSIGGYAVYLSGITNGYDSTMAGVFLGVLCLSMLFFRCRIFDAISLGKERALDDSNTGLVVFDQSGKAVYSNAALDRIVNSGKSLAYFKNLAALESTFECDGRFFSAQKKELIENGQFLGKSVEVTDITDSVNYQSKLEHDVKQRTEKIELIQRSIIAAVANIVEARSVETGEHIKRTSELSEMIAKSLSKDGKYLNILSKDYIRLLASAAPLHDIGKISVPDSILLKPGKLTAQEYDEMKIHTESGAQIIESTMRGLEDDEYTDIAKDVALYHHEWWDGSGYPRGLKGSEIPLSARIMAVADCYDALVSERCYKPPFTREQAIEIIKLESGTHFDPAVVESFIRTI